MVREASPPSGQFRRRFDVEKALKNVEYFDASWKSVEILTIGYFNVFLVGVEKTSKKHWKIDVEISTSIQRRSDVEILTVPAGRCQAYWRIGPLTVPQKKHTCKLYMPTTSLFFQRPHIKIHPHRDFVHRYHKFIYAAIPLYCLVTYHMPKRKWL